MNSIGILDKRPSPLILQQPEGLGCLDEDLTLMLGFELIL